MPLERLQTEILKSRDERQERIDKYINSGKTLISVSVNMPGCDKKPEGIYSIFNSACNLLKEHADQVYTCDDILGPFALLTSDKSVEDSKQTAVNIENGNSWGRLIDIDIYDDGGLPVSRTSLGFPERQCLICENTAKNCIKAKNHSIEELIRAANDIINNN